MQKDARHFYTIVCMKFMFLGYSNRTVNQLDRWWKFVPGIDLTLFLCISRLTWYLCVEFINAFSMTLSTLDQKRIDRVMQVYIVIELNPVLTPEHIELDHVLTVKHSNRT